MSIFGSIVSKIVGYASSALQHAEAAPASAPAASSTPAASQAAPATALQNVDVDAVLNQMASQANGGGNWRSSVVDLLKLLNLDSSLAARKQLAEELNVHAGADGSAEENIALHKAVMQKIAENGGKVPAELHA